MRDLRRTARRCACLLGVIALVLACLSATAVAAPKPQTVEIKSTPPQPARIGNAYTIRATATSGLEVKFSSEAPSLCEVGKTTVNEGVSEAPVELFAAGEACK